MATTATSATSVLEEARVDFQALPHPHTESALGEARALGISPGAVGKTILVKTPAGHIRAVVPAAERLDLHKVCRFLGFGKSDVRLLDEDELARDYPEFELGAVPPFGGLHADRVLVDRRIVGQSRVVVEAGRHDASLRLPTADLVRVTRAEVVDICTEA